MTPPRTATGSAVPKKRRGARPGGGELLAAAVGAVPGGAARPGQQQMTEAIERSVATGEHLLVQAGTGTGKSLAYLAPALTVDGPVVVSTATLALQSQLVDHDLPRLADAVEPLLHRRPTFAVLKGRHHYLCLARLDSSTEEEPEDTLFDTPRPGGGTKWLGEAGRLGKQMQRLRDWAEETATGDRDELDPGVDDQVWRTVSMPARECVGATRCPFGQECFAEASRARAREADIVVTNHSLLAVDMLAGRHIVPPHKLLIVDEAHELADRVSSAAQAELVPELIDRSTRRARPLLRPEIAERLTEAGDALAVGLAEAPAGRLTAGLPPALREACTLLDAATRAALEAIGDIKSDDPDPVRKQQAKAVLDELSTTAQRLLEEADHDVAWVEKPENGSRRALVVAPLSVAGTLATHLYDERTVVATSATLALGGRFDTVARALGLEAPPPTPPSPAAAALATAAAAGRATAPAPVASTEGSRAAVGTVPATEGPGWKSLDVGSPFDYARQGILYVAAHLPRPSVSGLPEAAGEELLALVGALGGRTLGLFSSRRAAQQAAELLRARTDLPVLLQGEEALPLLVRRFREERESCLFGVMSLWQGVDVPGDSCQLVVIDRLPFPRPDEPLAAARAAAVDAGGGSGFAAVSVPIAAVRLAQGVGRLIRATGDRGVVAVLDSRLETARGYGPFLRRSLPPFWYTTRPDVARGALERLAKS
ncbi:MULTISPECIES: ATP-dependent DNA helicase [Micromonospora]|uniref:DNA 5'-3' helicase n=1 Tax=Micromonospora solifontis TaxID=2487138 RepID=A0ABX9WJN4_9ACTN|nr:MULTISPECIES: ATP-dependent DNA helicase [Micromonospora]NES15696.1 ATP-dependent DNA helicase [Micromonospora sp. PPF5-17B]NES35996.1 ATP-dependent DNA helicase [Micromonospora solifontis]NES56931.1 ATP-dependent DNA helicase [Micromonospora sp. PPF5-6]RNM00102.1 ATP-dependent DNA helicase [Micromonospora solifontis]